MIYCRLFNYYLQQILRKRLTKYKVRIRNTHDSYAMRVQRTVHKRAAAWAKITTANKKRIYEFRIFSSLTLRKNDFLLILFFSDRIYSYLSFVLISFIWDLNSWKGNAHKSPKYSKSRCICMRTNFWWVSIRIFINCIVFPFFTILFWIYFSLIGWKFVSIPTYRIQKLLWFELTLNKRTNNIE